jgi:hypothetical protein
VSGWEDVLVVDLGQSARTRVIVRMEYRVAADEVALYRTAFVRAAMPLMVFDLDTGSCVEANHAATFFRQPCSPGLIRDKQTVLLHGPA